MASFSSHNREIKLFRFTTLCLLYQAWGRKQRVGNEKGFGIKKFEKQDLNCGS